MTPITEQTIQLAADAGSTRTGPMMAGSGNPTGAQLLSVFPPRLVESSWLATEASRPEVLTRVLAAPFALDNSASQQTRRLGALAVLNWLQGYPGANWQQRWQASGAETNRTGGNRSPRPRPHATGRAAGSTVRRRRT